ncbi:MAG TPA: TolC family protein [Terriglobia bacterium]|nr:TolC family protein [Terriglobia bacterium]
MRTNVGSASIDAARECKRIGSKASEATQYHPQGESALAIFWTALALLVLACGSLPAGQKPKNLEPGATLEIMEPESQATSSPPLTLSLQDAIHRAQENSPAFQTAVTNLRVAREARLQARAAMLPSVDETTQYLNTEGNGISPVGRFVTNDGVHVYREWGVVHEGMPGTFFIDAGPRSAAYQEALARADQEIARRGLVVTVTTAYYGLVVAQREYATAQIAADNARHLLEISRDLERGGEVARTDVIRFQLQLNQEQQALQDAELAMSTARLNLAVLLFPTLNENFTVVDDLDMPPALPQFQAVEILAKTNNPQIRAAVAAYRQAALNVSVARAAFYPSFSIDLDYGIEANAFALDSINTDTPLDRVRQPNLGYFVTYAAYLPVWDWGARISKLRQAHDQRNLARLNLTFAQRQILSQLYSFYNQAHVAEDQLDTLRSSVHLATQNLQLVTMSYKAGESTELEVLDAENSLTAARDAYSIGEAKYRNALATLQTLTGSF